MEQQLNTTVLGIAPWQVTVVPHGTETPRRINLYASSAHEARMLGAVASEKPNTAPNRVVDVCLLVIAQERSRVPPTK
jgi:hypothetical protein